MASKKYKRRGGRKSYTGRGKTLGVTTGKPVYTGRSESTHLEKPEFWESQPGFGVGRSAPVVPSNYEKPEAYYKPQTSRRNFGCIGKAPPAHNHGRVYRSSQ